MHFYTFSNFAQKIFKGWGCNFTWRFDKVMHSKSQKLVFVARIVRHKLRMIYAYLDYFLTTEIDLTTRGPLYICLVCNEWYNYSPPNLLDTPKDMFHNYKSTSNYHRAPNVLDSNQKGESKVKYSYFWDLSFCPSGHQNWFKGLICPFHTFGPTYQLQTSQWLEGI